MNFKMNKQLGCPNSVQDIETMLETHHRTLDKLIFDLSNDGLKTAPQVWHSYLEKDIACECRMQYTNQARQCVQCYNMSTLTRLSNSGEQAFDIEYGNIVGNKLNISSTPVYNTYLEPDFKSYSKLQSYISNFPQCLECGTPNTDSINIYCGDPFTVKTILHYYLYNEMRKINMPHIAPLHTAFICSNIGYSLYDSTTQFSFEQMRDKLTVEDLRSIVKQIIVMCHFLSMYGFNHGMPILSNLLIEDKACNYVYNNIEISGRYTVLLGNLTNASCTILNEDAARNMHIYCKREKQGKLNSLLDINPTYSVEKNIVNAQFEIHNRGPAYCSHSNGIHTCTAEACLSRTKKLCDDQEALYFIVKPGTEDYFFQVRHLGYPIYTGGLDVACFLLSLYCEPTLGKLCLQDPILNAIFSCLWLDEDIEKIKNRMHIGILNEMLYNIRIRCDLCEYLMRIYV